MGQVTFKIDDTFADMVRFCRRHKPKGAYDTRIEPTTVVCLWLVHDQGVYLMPGIEKGGKAEYVVYGRGCDPNIDEDWWDTARAKVGGDDFAESVELTEDTAKAIEDGRFRSVTIHLSETEMRINWNMAGAKA